MKAQIPRHALLKELKLDLQTRTLLQTVWCFSVGDVFGVNCAGRLAAGDWTRKQYEIFLDLQCKLKKLLNKGHSYEESRNHPEIIKKSTVGGQQRVSPNKRTSAPKAVNSSVPEPPAATVAFPNEAHPSRPGEDSQLLRDDQFSVRTWCAIRLMGISTQAEFLALKEDRVLRVRNVGQKIWTEIERAQGRLRSGLWLESWSSLRSEPDSSSTTPAPKQVPATKLAPSAISKPVLDAGLIEQLTQVLKGMTDLGYSFHFACFKPQTVFYEEQRKAAVLFLS